MNFWIEFIVTISPSAEVNEKCHSKFISTLATVMLFEQISRNKDFGAFIIIAQLEESKPQRLLSTVILHE
jgi:hypothetical protein